ncbi:MAG: NADH dehydrogenase [Desulfovibrio sp. MES5]|uniref:proton-conducting transporter transmembrane domain-containing protein n=1 Tax=Desulfovibrio sp. MES5 TaxID=1899016 RepID=UPI000B9CF7C8|nr:proton-conducting transporter membrane subunit [Desulfovibrio sp. MES5]OXS29127.1 MAG: NADH dehydrogenase [Desulfovibrio sp. MES5]
MTLFIITLLILAATAAGTALLAFLPPTAGTGRAANLLGSCGAAAGCVAGLCALAFSPWAEAVSLSLPWGLPIGACTLGLDPLSRIFLLPVFGLGLVCAISGGIALRHEQPQEHNLAAHWFFYLLLLLGLALVMAARDAVLFMLSWELMSLAPFFLIDFNDGDRKVRDASWVYLVAAHLGAVALMAFFVLLWQSTGATSFEALQGGAVMLGVVRDAGPHVLTALFVLAVLGFGAKMGLAPMHVWLPEAHPAAPSHVSALLSGAMINAGLYGIIRSLGMLAAPGAAPEWWGWALLLVGLGTGLMGILKALGQSNLKRLLAYSSVENMGLMLMGAGASLIGLSCGNAWIATLGMAGCLMHMLNHAGFKGLLFLCAGEVLHATGTVRMELLGGLQKSLPLLGAAFALGAAAIACLPPLNGFAGELVLTLSLLDGPSLPGLERQVGLLLALVGLALISGLAAALYTKAYGITFLGEPRTGFAASARPLGWKTLWPLALPAAVCVAGGLAAPAFFDLASMTGLAALPMPNDMQGAAAAGQDQARASLAMVSLVCSIALGLALAGIILRKRMLRRRSVRSMPTWGCGYQGGSARIQYTDAGFSEPLAKIFAPGMGLNVRMNLDSRLFPKSGSLSVSAPDRLRNGFYTPLFEAVERLCNACKIIQHGKIHLYILYILATVVGLLIWGLSA